jgi:hypothetical protein
MADDYAARLEAKRKDDEKRWRDLQYQLSVGSPMGQTNKAIEAQQMLGQISGAGGTRPSAAPGPSWLNAATPAGPRPMLTPEQRAAQSRVYESTGREPIGRRESVEDERKRLEAMLAMLSKDKFNLSPQEKLMMDAAQRRWSQLSGIDIPAGTSTEAEEDAPGWWQKTKRFFGFGQNQEQENDNPFKGLK